MYVVIIHLPFNQRSSRLRRDKIILHTKQVKRKIDPVYGESSKYYTVSDHLACMPLRPTNENRKLSATIKPNFALHKPFVIAASLWEWPTYKHTKALSWDFLLQKTELFGSSNARDA